MKSENLKIGIFGGTFDPPHLEHEKLVKSAIEELGLDMLFIVPVFSPCYKGVASAGFSDRLALAKIAFTDIAEGVVSISPIEKSNGFRYAFEVCEYFREKYKSPTIYYIVGSDSLNTFSHWRIPERVLSAVTLAVAMREGDEIRDEVREKVPHRVLKFVGHEVSSAVTRGKIELGLPTEDLSPAVRSYIDKHKLYHVFDGTIEKLRASVSAELFEHCVSTALYALTFINTLSIPYNEVFVACLLHDCAKELAKTETEKATRYADVPQPVRHQFLGADVASTDYGITSDKILDAIRFHTTGKGEMTTLGRLVYLADKLEPLRDYEGVEEMRAIARRDFEEGFRELLVRNTEHLRNSGKPLDKYGAEAYNYYIKNR